MKITIADHIHPNEIDSDFILFHDNGELTTVIDSNPKSIVDILNRANKLGGIKILCFLENNMKILSEELSQMLNRFNVRYEIVDTNQIRSSMFQHCAQWGLKLSGSRGTLLIFTVFWLLQHNKELIWWMKPEVGGFTHDEKVIIQKLTEKGRMRPFLDLKSAGRTYDIPVRKAICFGGNFSLNQSKRNQSWFLTLKNNYDLYLSNWNSTDHKGIQNLVKASNVSSWPGFRAEQIQHGYNKDSFIKITSHFYLMKKILDKIEKLDLKYQTIFYVDRFQYDVSSLLLKMNQHNSNTIQLYERSNNLIIGMTYNTWYKVIKEIENTQPKEDSIKSIIKKISLKYNYQFNFIL